MRGDEVDATISKENAKCGARHREHDRFGEELASGCVRVRLPQRSAPRTDVARNAAGQHENGDIGTPDEQKQENGGEQQSERALKIAENLLIESHDPYLSSLGEVGGVLLGVAVDEWLQLRDKALMGHAGFEFDEGQHVVVRVGFEVAGEVDITVTPGKAGIGDADDGVESVIKLDGFADNAGLPAILLLPEEIAEYSNGLALPPGASAGVNSRPSRGGTPM